MTDDELLKVLMKELSKEKLAEFNTTLIIGRASKLTKRLLARVGYKTITTADEVRDFLDFYSTPTDSPIFFEDVSKMTPTVQSYLLKFIEEPPAPLVILASLDNISPVLLSRCRRCIKFPEEYKIGSKSVSDFTDLKIKADEEYKLWLNDHSEDKSPLHQDVLKFLDNQLTTTSLQECPMYWYIKSGVSINISHLDKFIRLL